MKVTRTVRFLLTFFVLVVLTSASFGSARTAKWKPFPPPNPSCPATDMTCW